MIGAKREDSQISDLNDTHDNSIRLGSQKFLDSAEPEEEMQAEIVGEYVPVVEAKLADDEDDNFFRSPGCVILVIFGAILMTAAVVVPPKLGGGDGDAAVPAPDVRPPTTSVPTVFPTTSPSEVPTIMPTSFPTEAPSNTPTPTFEVVPAPPSPLPPTPPDEPVFDPSVAPSRDPTLAPSTLIPTLSPSTAAPTLPPPPTFIPSSDATGISMTEVVAPVVMGLVLVAAFAFLWNRHRMKRAKRQKVKISAQ